MTTIPSATISAEYAYYSGHIEIFSLDGRTVRGIEPDFHFWRGHIDIISPAGIRTTRHTTAYMSQADAEEWLAAA